MSICGHRDNAYFYLRRMMPINFLLLGDIWIKSVLTICTLSSSALIRVGLLNYWHILYLPMLAIKIVLIHWALRNNVFIDFY